MGTPGRYVVFNLQHEFQYKILDMSMNLELPEEVVEALGPEPERSALEAMLLFLVSEHKISVVRLVLYPASTPSA